MTVATRVLDAVDERRRAFTALVAQPFVDAGSAEYALIRRHEHELARICADVFGYRLDITATAARVVGVPTAASLRRPLRIRPHSPTGARRPVDEWPRLSDRAAVFVCLALAALERSGTQSAIAELARAVQRVGADADPAIRVDFDLRAERLAFADALDLLCAWGVLEHTAGSHDSYSRREQGDDEALLTIDRRRLVVLPRDPLAMLGAARLEDLLDESASYVPSEEGERRRRAHGLARGLLEDPAVVLADLTDEERTYFVGQRARLERSLHDATGVAVERRAEGSALIIEGRELTDLPFPTNGTVKQLCLLLCDVLAESGGALPVDRVRAATREMMVRYRRHWQREPDDPVQVDELARAALDVLCSLDLAEHDGETIRARPLCGRFRDPSLRAVGAPP